MEVLKADYEAAVVQLRADCAELFWDIDVSRLDLLEHYKCELRVENRCQHQHCCSQFSEDVNKESLR